MYSVSWGNFMKRHIFNNEKQAELRFKLKNTSIFGVFFRDIKIDYLID